MKYKLISYLIILGVSLSAIAAPHVHGTRAHDHLLPKQGVKHRHGNGAYGTGAPTSIKRNNQQSTDTAEQYTNIGRLELKKYLSDNTLEVTIDNSYKISWIIPKLDTSYKYANKVTEISSKDKTPRETLILDSCSMSFYEYCFGDVVIKYPRRADKEFMINKDKTHFFARESGYRVKYEEIQEGGGTFSRSKSYSGNLRFNIVKGHSSKDSKTNDSYLDEKYTRVNNFMKHYNLNSISGYKKPRWSWTPLNGNKSLSLNGKGVIHIKTKFNGAFEVRGEFKNSLIKAGKLKVWNSKKTGLLSFVERVQTYNVNQSSNLIELIANANQKNTGLINKHISENTSSVSTSHSSFCGVNDTCYKYIKSKKSGAAIVRCTKGSYTGQEKCLSFKKGKYATGCGLSDSFAHHHTLKKAANRACGQ